MEKINLNGKWYVLIEDVEKDFQKEFDERKRKEFEEAVKKGRKQVDRFNSTQEEKIISALNVMFDNNGIDTMSEEEVLDGACVIDACNVLLVCGKSEKANRILSHYISFETERKEMPKWDFIAENQDGKALYPSSSRFSMEYLNKIFKFFDKCGEEAVRISVLNNHPIKIEDSNFAFILAPRIEQDDEEAVNRYNENKRKDEERRKK